MAQLNLVQETEVFYMLFERCLSMFSITSIKQGMEYFNFRCLIKMDHPVQLSETLLPKRRRRRIFEDVGWGRQRLRPPALCARAERTLRLVGSSLPLSSLDSLSTDPFAFVRGIRRECSAGGEMSVRRREWFTFTFGRGRRRR